MKQLLRYLFPHILAFHIVILFKVSMKKCSKSFQENQKQILFHDKPERFRYTSELQYIIGFNDV